MVQLNLSSSPYGSKLFSFKADTFSEVLQCTGKIIGSHKSWLPCKKVDNLPIFSNILDCIKGQLTHIYLASPLSKGIFANNIHRTRCPIRSTLVQPQL